ncbi:MAG: TonB-dependent receptor [Acidobacteria bacterium]|nr:TonB-dependent receptor [Acidobacteriota bacterium]
MRKLISRFFNPIVPALWWLICIASAFAQGNASIAGIVSDSKGVLIPGATVSIATSDGKLAEALTDWDGSFRFESLQSGIYQITVEIVGFAKSSTEGVDLSSDSGRNLAIRIEPVPRPVLAKAKSAASREQSQQQQQTPILDSQAFQTAAVMDLPGLNQFQQDFSSETDGTTTASSRTENLLFVSGNSANLDSGNLSDPGFREQMMDAARQMGFQLQEFSAGGGGPGGMGEMGGGPGGGAPGGGGPGGGGPGGMGFGMMGRRGRGASFKQPIIEGSLTETYSNSALNARNYSLTGQTLPKPVQIQNNFSLTVGGALPFMKSKSTSTSQRGFSPMGPVSQPGWSFTYGGSRNRSAMDILTTVPTDLERTGDFSQTYVQTLVKNPETGLQTIAMQPVQLYLNPNDPASRFSKISAMDPIARQLLEFVPGANLPCAPNAPCVNNYALERSLPSSSDQIQISISGLKLTSRDNLGVNYSMRRGSSLGAATFPGLDTDRSNFGQNIGISGMHSFKSRLMADWRISFNQTRIESTNAFSYTRDVQGELGMQGVSRDPINWGPPTVSFSNYGNISLGAPSLNRNQTISVSAGFMKMGRKHSVRSGADISWNQRNSRSDSNGRGTYAFTGYATILYDDMGSQVPGTGNDFADFLLGLPFSTSRRFVDTSINPYGNGIYLRSRNWNLYISDNWRVRSNLTINYGVRYEYTGPSYEKYDRMVSLDVNSDFSELAQVFPDQKGSLSARSFPRSLINPDRNNLAPRVGIAWKPKPTSPFVFRLGYGISYNAGAISSIANQLINQAPFAINQNLAADRANPLTLEVGFPANPELTILNTFAIDPDYKASYAQQWSLDIQTQLSRLYVLNVSYMGSKGTGLDIMRAPNRSGSASNFIYQTNGANSIYHGLDLQLSRRFSRGFNMTNSYTFSKSIDNALGSGGSAVAQDDSNLAAERSLSNQDQRHNFRTSFMYELPFGQNRAFFAGASTKVQNFISGWTFNGNLTIASGTPMSARYASSSGSGSGAALYNSLRPDATGLPISLSREDRTIRKFFNTAAFSIPSGQYGNAGRNTIPGPGSSTVNLSMRKSIRLDENNRRFEISWQIQNLLNHPNWGSVSTTVNALNFGQVTGVRGMRSMTVNLRIRF